MPDSDMLNGQLGNILNFISAAGGLGVAAMGLVDATKVFNGGPSNFGFGYITKALDPFLVTDPGAPAAFRQAEVLRTLRANWLNGVATTDQKAKAKSLVHLLLSQGNAVALASAAGVNPVKLTSLAQKIAAGTPASQDEINVLGQFDAVLDAAYERADQKYRNASKILAMLVSTLLAGIAGWTIFAQGASSAMGYFGSRELAIALLVGVSATPLAPVAKDLATSLQAAVKAVRAVKP